MLGALEHMRHSHGGGGTEWDGMNTAVITAVGTKVRFPTQQNRKKNAHDTGACFKSRSAKVFTSLDFTMSSATVDFSHDGSHGPVRWA